jgi:molecular chaperone DnaK (HSP70)
VEKDIWYAADRPDGTRNRAYFGVDNVKRLIGRDGNDGRVKSDIEKFHLPFKPDDDGRLVARVGGHEVRPEEFTALSFLYALAVAEKETGQRPTACIATVPAYFTDTQRLATINAGRIAGIEVLRTVNEPTAVAAAYLWKSNSFGAYVVLDSGGGTTDGSLVELSMANDIRVLTVKATSGDNALGGLDFTKDLVSLFKEKFKGEIDMPEYQLFALCEEAKRKNADPLQIVAGTKTYEVSRKDYRKAVMPNLKRVRAVLLDVLEAAKGTVLKGVILAGGSSYFSLFYEYVEDLLPRNVKILPFGYSPAEVVALGAAVLTDFNGIVVTDVTNRSLGIQCQEVRTNKHDEMDVIVRKHSPIPVRHRREYRGAPGGTTEIALFEGEHSKASENIYLGSYFIEVVGGTLFEVEVAVTEAGLIEVRSFGTDESDTLGTGIVVKRDKSELEGEELRRMQAMATQRFGSRDQLPTSHGKRRSRAQTAGRSKRARRQKKRW